MTERTGLGPLELAVLRSVSATAGASGARARTTAALHYLDGVEGIGPTYGQAVLQDLGSWWRVLCPSGWWTARPTGAANSRRSIPRVPCALSTALLDDDMLPDSDLERLIGLPSLPSGGRVRGDIEGLYAGRRAPLLQSCRMTREQIPGGQPW